ncbi:MAG: histidine kinase [Actinomycetota bacterium]|nr:histidine kinase [Actinomycetota bacterium]
MWNGQIAVTRAADRHPPWWALVLVVVGAAPMLVRRTRPILAFVGCTAGLSALALLDAPTGVPLAAGIALFSMAAQRNAAERPARSLVVAAGGFAVYALSCAVSIAAAPWSELFHTALLWSVCWLGGERARLQREQLEELRRDAARERALATVEERMRIARDLHDSAGHAINVIAVHAGAARLRFGEDPDRTLRALSTIEELARRTVAEIDSMVGGLRAADDPHDIAPPSLVSLSTLVRQHADAGQHVDLCTHGRERPLPATVDQTAYRIVQEGLTNASRHGAGGARVVLDFGDDALTITITNPARNVAGRARSGHGLIGADERAGQIGGSVHTSFDAGEFVLTASLPITAGAPR